MKPKALLSALLIVAMLLCPVARMETAEVAVEAVDEIVPDQADVELYGATDDVFAPGEDAAAFITDETYAASATLYAANTGIPIDAAHFPDPVFRRYVWEEFDLPWNEELGVDDAKDDYLSETERGYVTVIDVTDDTWSGLKSLKGIEYFPNLEVLRCYDRTELTELDVSGNPMLWDLHCKNTGLVSLNVGNNPRLCRLWIEETSLTRLDLSNCPMLIELLDEQYAIAEGYYKETEDVERDWYLFFDGQTVITAGSKTIRETPVNEENFPDAGFRAFIGLYDSDQDGYLSVSDISGIEKLDMTETYSNGKPMAGDYYSMQGIELLPNLREINCANNKLTTLDVSGCPKLEKLNCENGTLVTLIARGCTRLSELNYDNNRLVTLDVSGCVKLREIKFLWDNYITFIDASGCTGLYDLVCGSTPLRTLDVSGCANLVSLACGGNQLERLNVAGCTRMRLLACNSNRLTSVDVSTCATLLECVKGAYSYVDDGALFYKLGEETIITCDEGLSLAGFPAASATAAPVVTPAPEPAPTPDSSVGLPTINATKKNNKARVSAKPGVVYRLNLGGATGTKFKSSKKKVATVSSAGLVTVRSAGKTKITFKAGKTKRTVTLTVVDPTVPTKVTLSKKGTVAAKVGEKVTLTATIPDGAVSGIKWSTSDKKVATVKNGVVTFKKKGKVTITATAARGKKKASVKFKVTNSKGSVWTKPVTVDP